MIEGDALFRVSPHPLRGRGTTWPGAERLRMGNRSQGLVD
jgi:hypothetical protein